MTTKQSQESPLARIAVAAQWHQQQQAAAAAAAAAAVSVNRSEEMETRGCF